MFADLATFTVIHVIISLIAIVAGFIVLGGLLTAQRMSLMTLIFLLFTAATSITGFLFPFNGFTPAIGVGIVAIIILILTAIARYMFRLVGGWRLIYTAGAVISLYLDVFVLIVQSFQKVPTLNAYAPTGSEPPFAATQGVVLAPGNVFSASQSAGGFLREFVADGVACPDVVRFKPGAGLAAGCHRRQCFSGGIGCRRRGSQGGLCRSRRANGLGHGRTGHRVSAIASGDFRSMHNERLFRLAVRKIELIPGCRETPLVRMRSPSPGTPRRACRSASSASTSRPGMKSSPRRRITRAWSRHSNSVQGAKRSSSGSSRSPFHAKTPLSSSRSSSRTSRRRLV